MTCRVTVLLWRRYSISPSRDDGDVLKLIYLLFGKSIPNISCRDTSLFVCISNMRYRVVILTPATTPCCVGVLTWYAYPLTGTVIIDLLYTLLHFVSYMSIRLRLWRLLEFNDLQPLTPYLLTFLTFTILEHSLAYADQPLPIWCLLTTLPCLFICSFLACLFSATLTCASHSIWWRNDVLTVIATPACLPAIPQLFTSTVTKQCRDGQAWRVPLPSPAFKHAWLLTRDVSAALFCQRIRTVIQMTDSRVITYASPWLILVWWCVYDRILRWPVVIPTTGYRAPTSCGTKAGYGTCNVIWRPFSVLLCWFDTSNVSVLTVGYNFVCHFGIWLFDLMPYWVFIWYVSWYCAFLLYLPIFCVIRVNPSWWELCDTCLFCLLMTVMPLYCKLRRVCSSIWCCIDLHLYCWVFRDAWCCYWCNGISILLTPDDDCSSSLMSNVVLVPYTW